MHNQVKKNISSALFLLLSSQASFSGAQEAHTTGASATLDLPMAEVIYNDQGQGPGSPLVVKPDAQSESLSKQQQTEKETEIDSDGRVFGYHYGTLHATLGITGKWTDNLYNYDTDKTENFLTTISPSVWLTWPRRNRRPLQVAADNTAVGGLQYSQSEYDVHNKIQLYFGGNLQYMTYSADSELDHAEGGLQAQVMYKPSERFSLKLMDNYSRSQDIFNKAEANSENDRVYDSNVLNVGLDWRLSDKFSATLGYSNHLLLYELDVNNFMDRADQGFNGALTYDYSPKTKFFINMSHLMAAYEEDEMPDNGNIVVRAGMRWQSTVKTGFMFGAGYQMVDYDEDWNNDGTEAVADILNDGEDSFNFEMQGIWQATRKSEFLLNSTYNIEQSDSRYALNKTVWTSRLAYGYRFTGRLRGALSFIYEDSDYAQFEGDSRIDERWNFSPSLDFALRKWLLLNLYYTFDKKDSNYDELDYETNTLGIGIRGTF